MWINQALSKNESQSDIHTGIVTDIVDGLLTVNSHTKIANIRVINPFPIASMPGIGQEVLLVPQKNGEYLCVGQAKNLSVLDENEVLISNGEGYIKLLSNGEVSINGLIITKGGQIVTA